MTTLLADAVIRAVPMRDNFEPLVDVRDYGIAFRPADPALPGAAAGALVREGVARRLQLAGSLLPTGVRLAVVEGWRSVSDQQRLTDEYATSLLTPRSLDRTATLADEDFDRLVSRHAAPLDVAPHPAGAAVDVTLCGPRGQSIWMGTPVGAGPERSRGACAFDAPGIEESARRNRTVMARALAEAGMINYPAEWWHWSFGDRYWAHATSSICARYDIADVAASLAS